MNKNAFLIIPYSILVIENLKPSEKLTLVEIISLSKKLGYCFASNRSIAKRIGVEGRTVSKAVTALKNQGYIESKVKNDYSRTITVNYDKLKEMGITLPDCDYFSNPEENNSKGIEKSSNPREKSSTNNNSYNNKYNNSYKERANSKRDYYMPSGPSYDIEELMKIK